MISPTLVLSRFLPVPALLAGRGVFVHQSSEFEQREFLQQQELGDGLLLNAWTGGQGGQALLAGPVPLLTRSAGHTHIHKHTHPHTKAIFN